MSDQRPLYHLALREVHSAMGARFISREGWAVPADYGDPGGEYGALRNAAAVFDRSQRSRLLVTGSDALDVLRAVFAGHVEELDEGRAMRTVALDHGGNIADLVLIARTGGISYLVSGEPGRRFETFARLERAIAPDFDARVDDRTETTCLVGLAGPGAAQVARDHLSDALPARMQLLHCVTFEFHGFRTLVIRTSDTGEDGFEFMLAPAVAQHVFETLRAAGVPPAGAESLEVARVEACIPSFEKDLARGLSPAEADLDVLLDIPGGREGRILSALLLDSPAETGDAIRARSSVSVGELRSCVASPGLNATIGLGIIDAPHALPGVAFTVGATTGTVVAKPFYRRRTATNG